MGYERKRGKLTEFNALLRGGARECFSEIVGETAILPVDQICHHARHRHAAAARCRPPARRHDGASAEPAAVRSGRGIVTEGYGILQPRVGVSLPSAGRSWFVRLFCRRRRDRSLHARGVGRLSGSFPGRLVHRQRNLRCGCLRARAGRPFPGEHRFSATTCWKRATRARPGQRRGALRGISLPLQRGHRPAPPLDSRRLADHAVAPAAGARDRTPGASPIRSPACRSGRSSTICGAVSSRSPCCFLLLGDLAALPGARRPGHAAGPRDHRAPGIVVGAGRTVAQAGAICPG